VDDHAEGLVKLSCVWCGFTVVVIVIRWRLFRLPVTIRLTFMPVGHGRGLHTIVVSRRRDRLSVISI
jgi:hypothetical protein